MKKSVKFLALLLILAWQVPAQAQLNRFIHFMKIEYGGLMNSGIHDAVQGGWLYEGQSAEVRRVEVTECLMSSPNDCIVHQLDSSDLDWSLEEAGVGAIQSGNWFCLNLGLSEDERVKAGLADCVVGGGAMSMVGYISNHFFGGKGRIRTYDTTDSLGEDVKFSIRAKIHAGTPGLADFAGYQGEYIVRIKNRFDPYLVVNQSPFEQFGKFFGSVKFSKDYQGPYNGKDYVNSCSAQSSSGKTIWFEDNGKILPATGEMNRIQFNPEDLRAMGRGEELTLTCVVADTTTPDAFRRTLVYKVVKP